MSKITIKALQIKPNKFSKPYSNLAKRHKKSTNVLKPSELERKCLKKKTSKYSLDKV